MRRVVLDTDVASLIIQQQLPTPLLRKLVDAQTGISFVTLGERAVGHHAPVGRHSPC